MSPAEVQGGGGKLAGSDLERHFPAGGQPPYTPWPEDNEKPYYTDKPDWDAVGAMLLVASCHTYEEPVPPTVEKDWNFGEHPLIARLGSDEERVWSLFRGVTWWLPLADAFFFQAPLPTDNIAPSPRWADCGRSWRKLNQLAWQADEDTHPWLGGYGRVPSRRDRRPGRTVQQGGHPGTHSV